jgi:hemolysin III
MITGDAQESEGGREAVSHDAAEAEYTYAAAARGEHHEDGLPCGSQGGESGHSVASLVERAADLAEPIKPRLRGWSPPH